KPKTIIFIITIAILGLLIYLSPKQPYGPPTENPTGNKAAIIDHLSISQPNQTFVDNATAILEQAGYNVSYFKGEEVTVDFYRKLPSQGFSFIVFRVHSTGECAAENVTLDWIVFFTGETYSTTRYLKEQMNGELVPVRFAQEDSPQYFGITPLFVKQKMNGDFSETAIVMMGCDGLKYYSMSEAFVQRGAKVYISWTGPVMPEHTDTTTIHLLKHLLLERITVAEAIAETREETGPDPIYKSQIIFYPITAAPYAIPEPVKPDTD
ncbi:MAG: hypothetical protein OEZ25_00580, partial [Candidatus Bathyarchaeota archaeon]|nr:hypothetical protein [Candidatus Bathyarchaeota archaeon]